jgi:hypothetical protein
MHVSHLFIRNGAYTSQSVHTTKEVPKSHEKSQNIDFFAMHTKIKTWHF